MTAQLLLFGVLAAIAVVCGIAMILVDNPVRSALYLVLVLFSVALLFLSLHAVFIAAIQVIVYAGAIMVLFIFVIMLLNLGTPERIVDRLKPQQPLAVVAGLAVIAVLATGRRRSGWACLRPILAARTTPDSSRPLGRSRLRSSPFCCLSPPSARSCWRRKGYKRNGQVHSAGLLFDSQRHAVHYRRRRRLDQA